MKKEELEYNIKKYVYQLIDDVMPENGLLGKIENRTAKYWVEQNQWRLDDILSVFMNKDGCIDGHQIIEMYKDVLFENGELRISLTDLVGDNYKSLMPDKIILFKEDDLYKLVGLNKKLKTGHLALFF